MTNRMNLTLKENLEFLDKKYPESDTYYQSKPKEI